MKQVHFLHIFVFMVLLYSCNENNHKEVLNNAEDIVNQYPDSALNLLQEIPSSRLLKEKDLAQYGWIKSLAHHNKNQSLIEDSLIVFSLNYYISENDTSKLPVLYRLVSDYYYENKDYTNAFRVLDEGIRWAKEKNDSTVVAQLYLRKAGKLLDRDISSLEAKQSLQNSLRYKEDASPYYLLGGWFADRDSTRYFFQKSIDIALQKKDTANAIHYLRNFAGALRKQGLYKEAIEQLQQALILSPSDISVTLEQSYAHLHAGRIDSAQYYLDKTQEQFRVIEKKGYYLSTSAKNSIAMVQAIIDYSLNRKFDDYSIVKYNDSIFFASINQHKILLAGMETKHNLEKENMQLIINKQQSELWFMAILLMILIFSVVAFFYIRNRKRKLLEVEENLEVLNRLLKEATENPNAENDSRFFKKILLQQLGLIKLVASVPTSANQEFLKQIASISNNNNPTDTLLAWDDLYPIVDSIYENFYSKLIKRYGNMLIEKEIQLCCLLCADFSTKEIQVVTQQSIPTIYQRKTTIRRKLEIGEKEDIVTFLNQQFQD